jgi:hypothetical protein
MRRPLASLVLVTVTLVVLTAVVPALVLALQTAVPAALTIGGVVAGLRLVWHYTNRDR